MDRAALYCRLSKEDIFKDSNLPSESIINQKLLLTEYALSHNFLIAAIYEDDDYSGLYDDMRPGFEKMLNDARKGNFNTIIAKSQSRFTRNMEHVEKYLHKEFPHLGIRFIGVIDNIDTNATGNKKLRQINGLINEWYCEDLSENIRTVFHHKMLEGQFLAPFAPYGYIKSPENNHLLVIDSPAAKIVKSIFNYYLLNKNNAHKVSFNYICNILNKEKIPPPGLYKKLNNFNYSNPVISRQNYVAKWSPSTIRRILTNETYIGSVVQGTSMKESYKSHKCIMLPKNKWIIIADCHEPIIEKTSFQEVQTILQMKRRI